MYVCLCLLSYISTSIELKFHMLSVTRINFIVKAKCNERDSNPNFVIRVKCIKCGSNPDFIVTVEHIECDSNRYFMVKVESFC